MNYCMNVYTEMALRRLWFWAPSAKCCSWIAFKVDLIGKWYDQKHHMMPWLCRSDGIIPVGNSGISFVTKQALFVIFFNIWIMTNVFNTHILKGYRFEADFKISIAFTVFSSSASSLDNDSLKHLSISSEIWYSAFF